MMVRITQSVYVNPEHVSSIYLEAKRNGLDYDCKYGIYIRAGGDRFCVGVTTDRERARCRMKEMVDLLCPQAQEAS